MSSSEMLITVPKMRRNVLVAQCSRCKSALIRLPKVPDATNLVTVATLWRDRIECSCKSPENMILEMGIKAATSARKATKAKDRMILPSEKKTRKTMKAGLLSVICPLWQTCYVHLV